MSKILFRDVSIINGAGRPPFAGEVLVEGNRIKAVGANGPVPVTGDTEIVAGHGAILIPCLCEAHAHLLQAGEIGLVQEGCLADLLLVDGDPL